MVSLVCQPDPLQSSRLFNTLLLIFLCSLQFEGTDALFAFLVFPNLSSNVVLWLIVMSDKLAWTDYLAFMVSDLN